MTHNSHISRPQTRVVSSREKEVKVVVSGKQEVRDMELLPINIREKNLYSLQEYRKNMKLMSGAKERGRLTPLGTSIEKDKMTVQSDLKTKLTSRYIMNNSEFIKNRTR